MAASINRTGARPLSSHGTVRADGEREHGLLTPAHQRIFRCWSVPLAVEKTSRATQATEKATRAAR